MPIPVTEPDELPTTNIDVLLLLHTPPGVASVYNVGIPPQISDGPTMAAGDALTVIPLVTKQLAPGAKVIVAVPAATPVTIPVEEPTVAIAVLLLLQIPEPTRSTNSVFWPAQTVLEPVMAEGGGVTATWISVVSVPPLQSVITILNESLPV